MNNELIFENIEIRIEPLADFTRKNMYHLQKAINHTFAIIKEKLKSEKPGKSFQYKDLLEVFRNCLEKQIEEKEFTENKGLVFEQIFRYTAFDLVYF